MTLGEITLPIIAIFLMVIGVLLGTINGRLQDDMKQIVILMGNKFLGAIYLIGALIIIALVIR